MQHSGHNAVDGKLLTVAQTHQRHGMVGHLKVSDVIKLNVTQATLSQELTHSTEQSRQPTRNDSATS